VPGNVLLRPRIAPGVFVEEGVDRIPERVGSCGELAQLLVRRVLEQVRPLHIVRFGVARDKWSEMA
jgi:hypothetical protein